MLPQSAVPRALCQEQGKTFIPSPTNRSSPAPAVKSDQLPPIGQRNIGALAFVA
jgi:hypothetical protein